MVARYQRGESPTVIAADYGVTTSALYQRVRGAVKGGRERTVLPKSAVAAAMAARVSVDSQNQNAGGAASSADGDTLSSTELQWMLAAEIRSLVATIEASRNEGELTTLAGQLRVLTQLADAYRRASPPEAEDVSTQPDYLAAAERCATRLRTYVERAREDERDADAGPGVVA